MNPYISIYQPKGYAVSFKRILGGNFILNFDNCDFNATRYVCILQHGDFYCYLNNAFEINLLQNYLNSFNRKLMRKDQVYKIVEGFSIMIRGENPTKLVFIFHYMHNEELGNHYVTIDQADCSVIVDSLRFILNFDRETCSKISR